MTVRVRFAPSPTGFFHIGSLRTVLFNYLFAKRHQGTFILRIEDTDFERSNPEFETSIFQGMAWMGMDADEGPLQGGPSEFYRQSERFEKGIYQKICDELIKNHHVYPCFCTEEELDQERAASDAIGKAYVYSRKCLYLSKEEVAKKKESLSYTLRFKMPNTEIVFHDLVRGEMRFEGHLISDFVITRSNGSPAYNFAVVIDDHLMKISHVIRGVDHISNTPKQIALYQALGYPIPLFAHFPMILGADKTKLSKRHGATDVMSYKEQGFLPEALFNFLALLSWSSGTEQEIFTRPELINLFSFDRVQKAGAVFDLVKLKWMNGLYIRALDPVSFYHVVSPYFNEKTQKGISAFSKETQIQLCHSVQATLDVLTDINEAVAVYLKTDDELIYPNFSDLEKEVISFFLEIMKDSAFSKTEVESLLEKAMTTLSLNKGKILKPLRLGVTAESSGPNLADLMAILGKECVSRRLDLAISK